MKHFGMKFLAAAGLCLAATVAHAADAAAKYPEKMIRIVVPYAPGGFNDTLGRLFARKLQEAWGQPVVVENKGGAGTIVGTEMVARATPDGYTLLINGFPLILNQYLHEKLPYDTAKDFVPVIAGAQSRNLLVVRADSPIKTVADLVARAKAEPGKFNYASAGNGSSNHVTMEYFKNETGAQLTQIPYKGSAPMITDLLGGQVDVMFDNVPHVLPHVQAGKMRALAITSKERSKLAPDVPTVAEQGYPDFEVAVPYGLFAPAGTPKEIVAKINAELQKAIATPEVQDIFAKQGVETLSGSPEDFQKFFQAQMDKWSKVVKATGIKAN
ncbi:Bug family tripartite tricarboxylate transporter substrate binding protein [Parapusillimonas granuli]|nr:tripartite tricarboxylate transporter substrate binding protein [Parapusillimonas granuli]MBB5215135.1 tripartite-type tricarboxylate transporter receptor subunit TctC [Parapusillimonas granuli]MEB2401442.1 tripartite tricarboxylate transporter substrate binding protein [Alcaligenaceae bacterium]